MDEDPGVTGRELDRALDHLAQVNRGLGGIRSLRRHVLPLVRGVPRATLLDVGSGDGHAARELARMLGDGGTRLEWTGLDLHPGILARARRNGAPGGRPCRLVRADARRLPFPDGAFDLATASLLLHHFDDGDAVRLLGEMARVARTAVLVSDLERHPVHYLGARLLAATWWRGDRITRHDGPVSVLRAFNREELLALAECVPARSVRVVRYTPFRLLLEIRP